MSFKSLRPCVVPALAMALAVIRFCAERYWDLFLLGDSFQAYAHFNLTLANLLTSGELPQWLPYAVFGAPAAPYNQAFLSPFAVVAALAGSALHISNAWSLFNICLVLELWVMALGAWLLSGELFATREARAAVTFAAVLAVNWHLQLFWWGRMLVYWPLLLLYVLRLRRLGDAGDVAAAGLAGLLLIYGSVTYAAPVDVMICLVAYGAAAALLGLRRPFIEGASLRRPRTAALWGLLAGVGGAYAWLLSRSFEHIVVLAPLRRADGTVSLETFLAYGGLATTKLGEFFSGFPISHLETFFYVGVMATGLAVLGLIRRPGRMVHVLFATTLFLFLLSLGPDGLVAYAAYHFPLADRFRHLSMLVPLVRLFFLILAGFGVEALARSGEGAQKAFRLCLLAAPAMLLLKWTVFQAPLEGGWIALLPEIGAGLCLAAWAATRLCRRVTPAHAATAVLVLELALSQWALDAHADMYPQVRGNTIAGQDLTRARPLVFKPHRLLASEGEANWPVLARLGLRQPVNNVTLLDLAGVDLCAPAFRVDYVAASLLEDMPWLASAILFKSNMPMPPADRITAKNWQEERRDRSFRETCGCGEYAKLSITGDPEAPTPEVLHFSANRLRVRTRTTSPAAALRYADNYDPRWRATVDGKPAPVENAHPFKSLRLPPGEHVAEFVFHDPAQDWALRLSSIAAVLALAWMLASELRADALHSRRRADEVGPEA
jgi:hypothetical protein